MLEAPHAVKGNWDPDRLAQVLRNLLANAMKFSPHDGRILVRLVPRPSEVLVSVSDDGVGIAQEDMPGLFEAFSRGSTAGDFEGTGLGLFVARSIVEAHSGQIWAESPGVGRGATLLFVVPYQ